MICEWIYYINNNEVEDKRYEADIKIYSIEWNLVKIKYRVR